MPRQRPPHLCALGLGGSIDDTLPAVADALRARLPGLRVTLIDLQPCHLRSPGRMKGHGADRVIHVSPADLGLWTPVSSWSLNLALNGGGLAYRRMVALAGRMLDSLDVDGMLCCHDRKYVETAFLNAAHRRNVPTVLLQEGPFCVIGHGEANDPGLRLKYTLAPLAQGLGLLPGMPDYGTFGHDRVLAASSAYAARWRAAGVPAERIAVTGVPRYDGLAAHRRENDRPPAAEQKVGVLLQPFARHGKVDAQAAGRAMAEVASGLDTAARRLGFELNVRPHPRATDADTRIFTDRLRGAWRLDETARPFVARAREFDLVVGFYSSSLLEAAAIGVPTLCFRLPPEAFAEPGEAAKQDRLRELGMTSVADAEALDARVGELLSGDPPEVVAEDEIGILDGRAAGRVADALAPLLTTGTGPERPARSGERVEAAG